jgi:glutaredoxin
MGDFLSRFWPTIVGVLLLALAALILWPSDPPVATVGPAPTPVGLQPAPLPSSDDSSQASELDRRKALEDARLRADLEAARKNLDARAVDSPRDAADDRRNDVSAPRATLTQNSPEVQRALRLVEVELYETSWCQYCRKTRAYLQQSGINFRAYDIEADETAKLRRQRLAPGTGVPLTVIDGQAIQGFSEQSLNAAFQSAIQRRLAAR